MQERPQRYAAVPAVIRAVSDPVDPAGGEDLGEQADQLSGDLDLGCLLLGPSSTEPSGKAIDRAKKDNSTRHADLSSSVTGVPRQDLGSGIWL